MLNPHVSTRMRADADRRKTQDRTSEESSLILHVDMDAFFAAIEERDNPALKGHPVIIGGPKGTRGVVTTCNYVARGYGVHSGMSLYEAGKLCPDGIFLKTTGRKYMDASIRMMAILRQFSPKVEPYSVDEAFLDASGCAWLWGGAREYGAAIKRTIMEKLNLVASVGIGPSRTVAKIASGLDKPDGLLVIDAQETLKVLGPLSVRKIPGVGKATEQALLTLDIHTIEDLIRCPVYKLRAVLGMAGEQLHRTMRGKGGDKVVALEERPDDKSMGHENTFMENVIKESVLQSCLLHLCDKAARRMRREQYVGNLVTLKLRTFDFHTRTHQRAMKTFTNDPIDIYETAKSLLRELWREGDKSVRLIGISVSHLMCPSEQRGVQDDLFLATVRQRREVMFTALDRVRDRYGEDILGFAGGMRPLRNGVKHMESPAQ